MIDNKKPNSVHLDPENCFVKRGCAVITGCYEKNVQVVIYLQQFYPNPYGHHGNSSNNHMGINFKGEISYPDNNTESDKQWVLASKITFEDFELLLANRPKSQWTYKDINSYSIF